MTFTEYRCWDPSKLSSRLQTEADFSDDQVFLATHTDFLVGQVSQTTGPRDSWPVSFRSPNEVLEIFLAETGANLTRAVVLGNSGSGKSHFIHWLKLRIPLSPGRHVVSVPRSGINLRAVLERLIALLPPDARGHYQDELRRSAFSESSPEQRIEALIDYIALSFGNDPRLDPTSGAGEEERFLLESLPNLFHDPTYRKYLASQQILQDLVNHIGQGRTEYVPAAGRLEFVSNDLPLRAVQAQQMSRQAQDIFSLLQGDPETLRLAVNLINRNLDAAVGMAINFGGARLGELMKHVRREFALRNEELVLLVEDLALLQGLDSALIDALLVQPSPGEQLCPMRWAMAMTTGYYDVAPDTLKTRIDLVIDMDALTNEEGRAFGEDDLAPFAARYLNAARLSDEALADWANSLSPDEENPEAPNACGPCVHRDTCHSAFGTVDGIGLYPFRGQALVNMGRRKGVIREGRFNPRLFMQDVLRVVLAEGHELDHHRFPPKTLREAFPGEPVDPLIRQRLSRNYPSEAERQETTLSLWSGSARTPDSLPTDLWRAFGLSAPDLGDIGWASDVPIQVKPERPQPTLDQPRSPLIAGIHAWADGRPLRSQDTNKLRELVFRAILGAVDWDAEGLIPGFFAQATGGQWFRQESINFDDQELQPRKRQVQLQIPGPGLSRDDAAQALEALAFIRADSPILDAKVPGRGEKLAALTVALELWSRQVVEAIRSQLGSDGGRRLVAASVETLTFATVLSNTDIPDGDAPAEWLEAIFRELPTGQLVVQQGTLGELYRQVRPGAVEARELLRALCTASKGGNRGAVIDGARVLPALERVTRGWLRGDALPELGNIEILTRVRDAHNCLGGSDSALDKAARREMDIRKTAIAVIRKEFPAGQSFQELLTALVEFEREASASGVLPHGSISSRFQEALRAVRSYQPRAIQSVLSESDQLAQHSTALPRLPKLVRVDRAAVLQVVYALVESATTLQTEVATIVGRQRFDLGGNQRLSLVIEEAKSELQRVCDVIAAMEQ